MDAHLRLYVHNRTWQGAPERFVHNRCAQSTGTDILRTSLSIGRSVWIIAVGAEGAFLHIHLRRIRLPVSVCGCLEWWLPVTQPQLHDCPRRVAARPISARAHSVFAGASAPASRLVGNRGRRPALVFSRQKELAEEKRGRRVGAC